MDWPQRPIKQHGTKVCSENTALSFLAKTREGEPQHLIRLGGVFISSLWHGAVAFI